jgi:ATP-dependent exoDNAse (exonuclease V) beta subunit
MKPTLYPILSRRNCHERDKYIKFFEEDHRYIITNDLDNKYTSVTTWNHSHFPTFNADLIIKNMMKGKNWKEGHKYWGLTTEEIKKQWSNNSTSVSLAGTNLHFEIECFMNSKVLLFDYTHFELVHQYKILIKYDKRYSDLGIEWEYFINFVSDFPNLKPYRTEWTVYDEDLKISGSIDMVYENPDGTLSIYDWKRCKEITRINNFNKFAKNKLICEMPDANFWHYALQLNTYKAILERKYGKVVTDLYLVRLHPDAEEKNYELIKLPDLSREINELFEEREKEINKSRYKEVINEIA